MSHRHLSFAVLSLGLLAVCARAEPVPAATQALPLDRLKSVYLACDRAATQVVLDADIFSQCAIIGDELLKRGFDGDFERLLAWWRAEKARALRAEASASPQR